MGFFDFSKPTEINRGVTECQATAGAILLDVRTPGEYRQGHIPGSINLPLQAIASTPSVIENKDAPLYVYCYSGARSQQACSLLRHMNYTQVNDLGGIAAYCGKVE